MLSEWDVLWQNNNIIRILTTTATTIIVRIHVISY